MQGFFPFGKASWIFVLSLGLPKWEAEELTAYAVKIMLDDCQCIQDGALGFWVSTNSHSPQKRALWCVWQIKHTRIEPPHGCLGITSIPVCVHLIILSILSSQLFFCRHSLFWIWPSNLTLSPLLQAMIVRGFRGDSKAHKIYFSSNSSIRIPDMLSLLCLVGLIGATAVSKYWTVWIPIWTILALALVLLSVVSLSHKITALSFSSCIRSQFLLQFLYALPVSPRLIDRRSASKAYLYLRLHNKRYYLVHEALLESLGKGWDLCKRRGYFRDSSLCLLTQLYH